MALFKFRARKAREGTPIKVAITLGGKDRGYTPDAKDQYLLVETQNSGSFTWSAHYFGKKIDGGNSCGGTIEIVIP